MKKKGLYIHFPFCDRKCSYCDFLSLVEDENKQEAYMRALEREITMKGAKESQGAAIGSLFMGGGTPSLLSEAAMADIMHHLQQSFLFDRRGEWTIESNPESLTKEKIIAYRQFFNRISIGVQSFNDNLLSGINRLHNSDTAYKRVKEAVSIFPSVNIDLMFGLPYQTLRDVEESIDIALELRVNHLSAYSLILEEHTPMARQILPFPSEETERDMYNLIRKKLGKHGFIHYEISNFAKEGFTSQHNRSYWDLTPYLGLGLGASSFTGGRRYENIADLEAYIAGDFSQQQVVVLSLKEAQQEFMLLGLREIEGVSLHRFHELFKASLLDIFKEELNRLMKQDLLKIEGERIKLTEKGLHVGNVVFMEFV